MSTAAAFEHPTTEKGRRQWPVTVFRVHLLSKVTAMGKNVAFVTLALKLTRLNN